MDPARILEDSLPESVAADFARRQRKIQARYRSWRQSFPAYRELLDDDLQRAQALAANLATEGRATLLAWVQLQIDSGGGRLEAVAVSRLDGCLENFSNAWREHVRPHGRRHEWDGSARRRFDDVLDELVDRARNDGRAALQEAAARRGLSGSLFGFLGRPFVVVIRALGRFFWPR